MNKASRFEFARAFYAIIVAQLVLTGLVTHFTSLSLRPLAMVSLTTISVMAITAYLQLPRLPMLTAIILATAISVVSVYVWRRLIDPIGFIGPIPASFEIPALGVSAVLTILGGAIVALVSYRGGRLCRVRWVFVVLFSIVFVGGLFTLTSGRLGSSSTKRMQLQQVLQTEAHLDSSSPFERQELSFWLGVFGRSSEAQVFSTLAAKPYHRREIPMDFSVESKQRISSSAVSWRQAITEIAARERIVILMEAHNATQHREWIAQTLPIFHKAGFRHYAAETLEESGDGLKQRGYPVQSTGFYVADPRFGNLLRRAIELGYTIHEYEASFAYEIPQREEQQAQALANIIKANPDCKIVIHAGYAHSFKQPVPGIGPWMAARLWEKSGIEPYCIYQGHEEYDSPNYPQLVEVAGATDEPKMLIPLPSQLPDPQFAGIPDRAVDALVIHPLVLGKSPTARKPVFSSGMIQLSGRWLENEWPVIIEAFHSGEQADAIALDQVMLRRGESQFELWIPESPYELRVTSPSGVVAIEVGLDQKEFQIRRAIDRQNR